MNDQTLSSTEYISKLNILQPQDLVLVQPVHAKTVVPASRLMTKMWVMSVAVRMRTPEAVVNNVSLYLQKYTHTHTHTLTILHY